MTDAAIPADLERLVAPVPGDHPAGVSLRYDSVIQRIGEARHEDDASLPQGQWERPLKRADWNLVEQLCADALASRSKDLQIAAWLTEAWIHLRGLDGLTQGLGLIESLCQDYWNEIHPQIEDGDLEYRVAPLVWTEEKLPLTLRLAVPITEAPGADGRALTLADWDDALRLENLGRKDAKVLQAAETQNKVTQARFLTSVSLSSPAFFSHFLERLAAAAKAVAGLEKLLEERLGAASPGLLQIRNTLERMRQVVREFGGDQPRAAEVKVQETQGGAQAEQAKKQEKDMVQDRTVEEADPGAGSTGPIRSREDAYRRLSEAADYLLRTEPHSPCPYLVMRAVAWGRLPFTELLQEMVQGESDLRQLYNLLGMRVGK